MATSDAKYRIELFGGIRVIHHDDEISKFRTQKTAALLAYLALHLRSTVTREQLIELFWPELPPEAARNNLSTALSSLRSQLEPPGVKGRILQSDNLQIGLNPDAVVTDAGEFDDVLDRASRASDAMERAILIDRAISLYAGDLMAGSYEEWALSAQGRLRERYAGALRQSIEVNRDLDRLDQALDAANRLIALDPLDEESYLVKMRLQASAGRHTAVLETLRALQDRLSRDAGCEVSEALIEEARELASEQEAPARQRSHRSYGRQIKETASGRRPAGINEARKAPEEQAPPTISDLSDMPGKSDSAERPARSNLPLQLTRFFGRFAELEKLTAWLIPDRTASHSTSGERQRLVTLTGAGGAGKTRLAVEAASLLAPEYGGRVYFVGLAEIPDPGLLSYRLSHALGLQGSGGTDPIEHLASRREDGSVLLVLDNLEHLLRDDETGPKIESPIGSAAVAWVHQLLADAPQARCLVTSRRCLGLRGEQELPLLSLAMPSSRATVADLSECASVQLYVDRARKVKPDFAVTQNNAEVVAELCRRLEGMPLAIELAAAWARSMTPARMLERLSHCLDALAARQCDLPERHRSMRAVCEWSYGLLAPDLQRTFERLFVFHSGFTLEAAEAVCGPRAAEDLQQLQEHSLIVSAEQPNGELRFRMLEALRQFAFEMSQRQGDAIEAQGLHAAYYAALVKQQNEQNLEQRQWVPQVIADYDNTRAALLWYMDDDARAREALVLAGDMQSAWKWSGETTEGRSLLTGILAHPANLAPTRERAEALNVLGSLSLMQADTVTAKRSYEESLAIFRQIGATLQIAGRLYNLALAYSQESEYAESRRLTEEALAILGSDGDPARIARYRGHLGVLAQHEHDFAAARLHLESTLEVQRSSKDVVGFEDTITNLGNLCYRMKDYPSALKYYEEVIEVSLAVGLVEDALYGICGFAAVAMDLGDSARAARLYSAFESGLAVRGIRLPQEVSGPQAEAHARLRASLGMAAYEACMAEGRAWTLEQAVAYALQAGAVNEQPPVPQ